LNNRIDTPWRVFFKLNKEKNPEWRIFYKPPLTKKTGDLQWRIVHGVIAVNAFTSVLNPENSDKCPFCDDRETIFHAFLNCYCHGVWCRSAGVQVEGTGGVQIHNEEVI